MKKRPFKKRPDSRKAGTETESSRTRDTDLDGHFRLFFEPRATTNMLGWFLRKILQPVLRSKHEIPAQRNKGGV